MKIMAERRTREEFGEKLIDEFASWATAKQDWPYSAENKKEAMEKFNLTKEETDALLHITAPAWLF